MSAYHTTEAKQSQAQENVNVARDEVKQKVSQTVNAAKDRGYSILSEQKGYASQELRKYGHALHSAAKQLQDEKGMFSEAVAGAAGRLDNASRYMEEHSPNEVVQSVNEFAHRHTGLFWSGMLFAGLAVSRFLKAGQSDEQSTQYTEQPVEENLPRESTPRDDLRRDEERSELL